MRLPGEPSSCDLVVVESRACNTLPCGNFNCTVSPWSEWEACPTECVNATVSRTRSIVVPAVGTGTCKLATVELRDCPICVCEQAIRVSPAAGITVTEGSSTDGTYAVWLNCQPDDYVTAAVTIPIAASEYLTVSPSQILFSPTAWTVAHAVRVGCVWMRVFVCVCVVLTWCVSSLGSDPSHGAGQHIQRGHQAVGVTPQRLQWR